MYYTQALNHQLVLKIFHRIIKLKQKAWLKSYINMNTDLRKKAKPDEEKDFFKLMNNTVFGKTTENVRKHRDIKPLTTERKKFIRCQKQIIKLQILSQKICWL